MQPSRRAVIDIDFVDEDFMKNMSNGYRVPPGRMKLSVVKASQLPKSVTCNTGSKGVRARWRILDNSQRKIPVRTNSLPQEFAGLMATNGSAEFPSAGV